MYNKKENNSEVNFVPTFDDIIYDDMFDLEECWFITHTGHAETVSDVSMMEC